MAETPNTTPPPAAASTNIAHLVLEVLKKDDFRLEALPSQPNGKVLWGQLR